MLRTGKDYPVEKTIMVVGLGDCRIMVTDDDVEGLYECGRCHFQKLNNIADATKVWEITDLTVSKVLSPRRVDIYYVSDDEKKKSIEIVYWYMSNFHVPGPEAISIKIEGSMAIFVYEGIICGYWGKDGIYVPGIMNMFAKIEDEWDRQISGYGPLPIPD
jgi:hypothetical protein